ncbi:tyrosine-protein phosphatase [Williamsia sp.]|uniref:tyrosine-protein phosphatase n=1 Tax=Williamsia sp. TaxID=1872085 RepID=UPI002F92A443
MTDTTAGHPLTVAGVPNLRDLGGWTTTGGARVRPSTVYRSTELYRLGDSGRPAFDRLGIRTVYDLRTAAERSAAPDPHLDGVIGLPLDVLADSSTAVPANLGSLFTDASAVTELSERLRDGQGFRLMADTYRQIVTLPSAVTAYKALFLGLAGAEQRPALFHCTTGKDRTGWAAASLLTLLGVAEEDVYRDYLLTNDQLLPALHPAFAKFEEAGGDPEVLPPVLGVDKAYLDAAFDEMRSEYGDIEGYFMKGLGIDEATLRSLRSDLTESP